MRLRFSDEDIRRALGYSEPDLKTVDTDIAVSGAKGSDYITPYIHLIWLWIKDNSLLVALIILGVLIGLFGLRKG